MQSLLREFVSELTWLVPAMIAATLASVCSPFAEGSIRCVRSRRELPRLNPGSMSVRLPEENVATEIRPLVAAVDRALDRLQQGFAVQRQFTANAAHELRTPLSVLSAGLEQLGRELQADAARMYRLVEQLLGVARLDAIALDVSETVDLSVVACEVVAHLVPLVLANERMIAAQVARAREETTTRFWRGRGTPGQGSGPGLAIVHETMKAHHGTIRVGDNPGGGAVITLAFSDGPTHSVAS